MNEGLRKFLDTLPGKPLKPTLTFSPMIPRPYAQDDRCKHPGMVLPTFDAAKAKNMSANEVRKTYPRGFYLCPQCRIGVITYASEEHYYAGDW